MMVSCASTRSRRLDPGLASHDGVKGLILYCSAERGLLSSLLFRQRHPSTTEYPCGLRLLLRAPDPLPRGTFGVVQQRARCQVSSIRPIDQTGMHSGLGKLGHCCRTAHPQSFERNPFRGSGQHVRRAGTVEHGSDARQALRGRDREQGEN
eukprot:1316605-Rhodomonas_salina.1